MSQSIQDQNLIDFFSSIVENEEELFLIKELLKNVSEEEICEQCLQQMISEEKKSKDKTHDKV